MQDPLHKLCTVHEKGKDPLLFFWLQKIDTKPQLAIGNCLIGMSLLDTAQLPRQKSALLKR